MPPRQNLWIVKIELEHLGTGHSTPRHMSTTRKLALKLTSLWLIFLILTLASRIAANGEDLPAEQALSISGSTVSVSERAFGVYTV